MKDYIPLFVLVPVILFALFFIWRSRNNDRLVIEGEEKPKDSVKAPKKPGWWSEFAWKTFIPRIVVQVVLNGLAFHYNWFNVWTGLMQDTNKVYPWVTSFVLVNALFALSTFLVSTPKDAKSKDLPSTHKAAGLISKVAILIVLVFLWNTRAADIIKPGTRGGEYSPVTLTCVPSEWSQTYTIKTRNICWDTTEDTYWVRVNNDPLMEYKGEPGKNVSIPPTPRVRTVQFRCDDKPMEVKITEKP